MTFIEFLATRDTPEDRPDDWMIWSLHWRAALPAMLHGEHCGDCTDEPQTCVFCWLEEMLRLYRIETEMRVMVDEARKKLEERWGDDGACLSCGWHAALYEHDVTDDDIADALVNHNGELRLSCISEDEYAHAHRGIRISLL